MCKIELQKNYTSGLLVSPYHSESPTGQGWPLKTVAERVWVKHRLPQGSFRLGWEGFRGSTILVEKPGCSCVSFGESSLCKCAHYIQRIADAPYSLHPERSSVTCLPFLADNVSSGTPWFRWLPQPGVYRQRGLEQ